MGREIRRVPENRNHPQVKDEYHDKMQYKAMYQADWKTTYIARKKDLKERFEQYQLFQKGTAKTFDKKEILSEKYQSYSDYAGKPPSPPNPERYMPEGERYQLFETITEGTPLSPPFATKQELIDWLSSNADYRGDTRSREAAERIVNEGRAPTGILKQGKMYDSTNMHTI